jgi:hypothetical protein
MVVRIDFSSLPGHLRNAIVNEISFKNRSKRAPTSDRNEFLDSATDEGNNINIADEVPFAEEKDIHRTYQKIKDALIKKRVGDYVATKHHKDENKVVILKRADAERQGIYHCRHCGMEFNDSIELSVHMRLHYVMT